MQPSGPFDDEQSEPISLLTQPRQRVIVDLMADQRVAEATKCCGGLQPESAGVALRWLGGVIPGVRLPGVAVVGPLVGGEAAHPTDEVMEAEVP